MSIRSCRLIGAFVVLLTLLPGFTTLAQSKAERVRFQRGHSSATIRGRIAGFDTKDYIVGAKAGQMMTLHLSSSNPSANFVIYSINGRPTDMNETNEWSERLSESGDYLIRVLMVRAGARRKGAVANYSLTISIQ